MVDFRPISLCNVSYKIIGKLLALRLKKCLPDSISETQAAFVEGRMITDNVLAAQEIVHALKSCKKISKDFLAIKTDISKAYDRLEWSFLEQAMRTLGFDQQWIDLIMACVTSVSYQVLVNGTPYGNITPTRGLRQGDPLSPYLFVLCTEILIRMLKKAEEMNRITGLRIARNAPAVTHLLFADDSLLYCKVDEQELNYLIKVINDYSSASGQRVNYQKSSILFGSRVTETRKLEIKRKLGIEKEGGGGMYLGLPESFRGSKVDTLRFLKDRLNQKTQGWQHKFLSPGGKETLLKAIALALPTYTMSCFKLPKTCCQQLVAIMANFWWKTKQDSKGIHWRAWEKLSKPKSKGGLGFKDVESFNIAMLGKQLWRLMTQPNSLVAKMFKSKYYPKTNVLDAKIGGRPSFVWRSLLSAQRLMLQGSRFLVGNGREINVWKDRWVEKKPALPLSKILRTPSLSHDTIAGIQQVGDLLQNQGREWNVPLLRSFVPADLVDKITQLSPGGDYTKDIISWDYSKRGIYSVKSGYWALREDEDRKDRAITQPSFDQIYKQLWRMDTAPKIHHFLWKCVNNCLAVLQNLAHKHMSRDSSCPRCPSVDESINHLLFTCPYARLIWAVSPVPAPHGGEWSDSIHENIHRLMNLKKENKDWEELGLLSPWLLWRIWKSRNDLVFKGKDFGALQVVEKAQEDAMDWASRKREVEVAPRPPRRQRNEAKWRKPPDPWKKCNSDGAWSSVSGISGIGWVLRNHEGHVLWMGNKAEARLASAWETEAVALRWAILSVSQLGYDNVIFEMDSEELKTMILEERSSRNIHPLVQDIRGLLAKIQSGSIALTLREGNKVADGLAKKALQALHFNPMLYTLVPQWLNPLVTNDLYHNLMV